MNRDCTCCYSINSLIEKMQSVDKDLRFMAVNDIVTHLEKNTIKLDDDLERKVVRTILKLLEDRNGEVQNVAVKCLGLLIPKIKSTRVEAVVEELGRNMSSSNDRLRYVSNIGLKAVVSQLPLASSTVTTTIRECILKHLIPAISQTHVSMEVDALEMLTDILHTYGSAMSSSYSLALVPLLISKFSASRQIVQKRAVVACSVLAQYCIDPVYDEIIKVLFNGLSLNFEKWEGCRYVQCVSAVCSQSGRRFGKQISRFMPLILTYNAEKNDDSVREYCLQAFQVFVKCCSKEITPHISSIIQLCLQMLVYDPNYNYDEESEEDVDTSTENMEEGDEYSCDDDDMTWRVRRAAVRCLEAIICTRHEMIVEFHQTLGPVLIERFKERDESVRIDVFQATISFINQTASLITNSVDCAKGDPVNLLHCQVPTIIEGTCKQMMVQSPKTRQICFKLLKTLCNVLPDALVLHMNELMPAVLYSLEDSNPKMKSDASSVLNCLLVTHSPEVFHPYISVLLPPIIDAINSNVYKTAIDALNVLQELIRVIRPLNSISSFDYTSFVNDIYSCILDRLKASDTDVKQQAIFTMGRVLSHFGDFLQEELSTCMPILLDRLKNEITRLVTITALTDIAKSVLFVDLPIVNEVISVLGLFLRQNDIVLKRNTLQLLDCLVKAYYNHIDVDLLRKVVVELPPLLNSSQLLIAQLTLILLESITRYHSCALQNASESVMPKIMELVKSQDLQGTAQTAMLNFFQGLVKCNLPSLGYNNLLQLLSQPILLASEDKPKFHKQVHCSVSKCIAAITAVCQNQALPVVNQCIEYIRADQSDPKRIFSLLVIGEIGREIDLAEVEGLKETIVQAFSSPLEEVKLSATYALGSVALKNLDKNLPFILEQMKDKPKQQHLLLYSLKEIIISLSSLPGGAEQLLRFIYEIWQQLFPHGESPEEGIRNIVAECLGRSIHIDPTNLLQELRKHLKHPSPLMRANAVTAIQFAIFAEIATLDDPLHKCVGEFLGRLQDPSMVVRRAALAVLNAAAHSNPFLIRDLLDSVLPNLYDATKVNKELIQEVQMGPFKFIIDEGLDNRRAAFECMYTLLNCCINKIDIFEFLNHVEEGLNDNPEVKLLAYLIVIRLAELRPAAVLQEMDKLVEPLRAACNAKVKPDSVQQEREKQDALKKAAMQVIKKLSSIPDADKNAAFCNLMTHIKNSSELQEIFKSCTDEKMSHDDNSLLR